MHSQRKPFTLLEGFFSSPTRVLILQQFFRHPEQSYHLRLMQRLIHCEVYSALRELRMMKTTGLLKSTKAGNKVLYHLNSDFIFYNEFKSMIEKYDDSTSMGRLLKS